MFKAEHFRTKQAQIADSMKNTDTPSETRKLEQSMKSLGVLAENEDWLADNFDKMIHAEDLPVRECLPQTSPQQSRLTPKQPRRSKSVFCGASARQSSCIGVQSRRICNASFSIPLDRWGTSCKRAHCEVKWPASYIGITTKSARIGSRSPMWTKEMPDEVII
jgi:hypothetical protein